MASILGLPDPSDYNAPTNWSTEDAPLLQHPSGQTPESVDAAEAPATEAAAETVTESAPAQAEGEITPFPPAPPTVEGDQITHDVNQG